jgi:hypothetical protein
MSNFLSIKEYDNISIRSLKRAGVPATDENISFLNEMMMKADMIYDDDKTGGTRQNFRFFYANFGIKTIKRKFAKMKKKERTTTFSSLHDLDDYSNRKVSFIEDLHSHTETPDKVLIRKEITSRIQNSGLKDKEKQFLLEFLFSNRLYTDIAPDIGMTSTNIHMFKNKLLKKIGFLACLVEG